MDILKKITGFNGTTGVACKNLNRNFILIEKEPEYVKICEERIKNTQSKLPVISQGRLPSCPD